MATLRVTSLRGRTAGTSPELPDGAIVGAAVTINASGVDAGAGIITATSFTGNLTGNVTGSATTIAGAPNVTLGNVNAGVITATTFVGVPAGFTELDAALFN